MKAVLTDIDRAALCGKGAELQMDNHGIVLVQEAASVKNLLRDSTATIRAMRYSYIGADSVLALASHGMEKLLKLVIGIDQLDVAGHWPTIKYMKGLGHDIQAMHCIVDETLRERADRPYLKDLQAAQLRDPLFPLVTRVMARYAQDGRFHGLDTLSGAHVDVDLDPRRMWGSLEFQAQSLVPNIVDGTAFRDNEEFDEAAATLRDQIARSIDRWWATVAQFLIIGALGPIGRSVGGECAPDGWRGTLEDYGSWHT